jgi:UDP-glucose 4-epimerase
MKRALITGASGFVGANLVRRLLRDGHQVHLLLRESHQPWRLEDVAADCRVTTGDVADRGAVRRCVAAARPEWVFHLSAYGAYSSQTGFEPMVATNIIGSANLLDACIESGVESFVQTGSSSEYGFQPAAAREDIRLDPNSHYAITKAAATHYCRYTAQKLGFPASTARLYSIYGPYEDPSRLIPTLLVHSLSGRLPPLVSPHTARDFVYVDDAVDALIGIASAKRIAPGAIYNVASGIQTSIAEVVEHARKLLGVSAEPVWGAMPSRSWDTSVWVGDPSAISLDLGWTATTSLQDGLSRTVRWLRKDALTLDFHRKLALGRK